tara:strand:+ start:331 stop:549 length:219 start_codon:yes stop_codon:yes gene_type:complete
MNTENEKQIKTIFDRFDKDKNGCINKKELNSFTIALNKYLSPAELSDLFKNFDEDNSGKISWKEFANYCCTN